MGKYKKTEIIDKARELAKMISETEEVEYFKKAEAKINENQKVAQKIKQIKALQKQAVNLQNYGKVNMLQKVEEKIGPNRQNLVFRLVRDQICENCCVAILV